MRSRWCAALIAAMLLPACGSGGPDEATLRDSFVAQLSANSFVRDVQRSGEEVMFSAPAAEGGTASWRVRMDEARIEENDDPAMPYKGTIKSSWYSNGQLVQPSGRESNLPVELTSNGLAQECWALWNSASRRWEWE